MALPSGDHVLIVANPKAGAYEVMPEVERLVGLLRQDGLHVEVSTDLAAVAADSARLFAAGQLRALVGAGGDGTVAEVVNRSGPGVPICLLPLGTENLLAKYLGLARDAQAVHDVILRGKTVRLDAGRAGGRVFTLMASCGFDADVVQRLHEQRRGHIRKHTYVKPILAAIRNYQYPELRIYCDANDGRGDVVQHAARWLFLFNLPCYAFGLQFAPDAIATDGLLDLCTFRRGSFWHGCRYLAAIVRGRHRSLPDCVTGRITRVRVEADQPVPYQLDGDPCGFLPLEAEVLPGRLTMLVPQSWLGAA